VFSKRHPRSPRSSLLRVSADASSNALNVHLNRTNAKTRMYWLGTGTRDGVAGTESLRLTVTEVSKGVTFCPSLAAFSGGHIPVPGAACD
jgi:hypothetical protein